MAKVVSEIRDEVRGNKVKILGCLTATVVIFSLLYFPEDEESLYDRAFEVLMKNEGGYVNHPADSGGETKYGICKKYNPNIDVKNITLDFAKRFYYKNFWRPMYDQINDKRIALKLFDISVNIGKKGLRDLVNMTLLDSVCYPDQDAIDELEGVVESCEEDDDFELWENYVTEKINSMDSSLFLSVFKSKLINFYIDLIHNNDSLHVFRLGWIKRAAK